MNSGFFYKSAEEREKLVRAERAFITERVHKIIELKKKLCNGKAAGDNTPKEFVIVNQKVRFSAQSCLMRIYLRRALIHRRLICWRRRALWHCAVRSDVTWSALHWRVVANRCVVYQ